MSPYFCNMNTFVEDIANSRTQKAYNLLANADFEVALVASRNPDYDSQNSFLCVIVHGALPRLTEVVNLVDEMEVLLVRSIETGGIDLQVRCGRSKPEFVTNETWMKYSASLQ